MSSSFDDLSLDVSGDEVDDEVFEATMLGPRAAQKDSPRFGGLEDVPVSPEDEVELIEVDLSQTTGDDTFSVQHAFPRDLNLKIVRSQYMISTYSLNSANGASVLLTYRGGSRRRVRTR